MRAILLMLAVLVAAPSASEAALLRRPARRGPVARALANIRARIAGRRAAPRARFVAPPPVRGRAIRRSH